MAMSMEAIAATDSRLRSTSSSLLLKARQSRNINFYACTAWDSREFRAVTGGVFHVSGGAARDLVQFQSAKIASRTFVVNISLSSGEYGFLPPGAFTSTNAASSGKIYSFRLIE